jgi:hypothetical protein
MITIIRLNLLDACVLRMLMKKVLQRWVFVAQFRFSSPSGATDSEGDAAALFAQTLSSLAGLSIVRPLATVPAMKNIFHVVT